MAVALTTKADGTGIAAGTPVALFPTRVMAVTTGGSWIEYDVSSDGKRFLMNTLVEHSSTPITLILNASAAQQ